VALVGMDVLALERPVDGLETIAKKRGALELEALGGARHLRAYLSGDDVLPTLEEQHDLIDRAPVFLDRGVTDARRRAALDVVQQAGTPPGKRARRLRSPLSGLVGDDRQGAGTVRKQLLQEVERLVDGLRVRVRAEVPRRAIAQLACPQHARERLAERHLDEGIGLVVLEPDVVAGAVLFDEVGFEEVGLRDRRGDDVVDTRCALGHPDEADIEARAEIRADAVPEDVGLPYIEDLPLGVLEEVDARRLRERARLLVQRIAA